MKIDNIPEDLEKMFLWECCQAEYGEIDFTQRNVFYEDVAAAQYAIEKLPLKDVVLQNAKFVNFKQR